MTEPLTNSGLTQVGWGSVSYHEGWTLKMATDPSTKKKVSLSIIANLMIIVIYVAISNKPINQCYLNKKHKN